METDDITEFDCDRITFSIVYDRRNNLFKIHRKIMLYDNYPVHTMTWRESDEDSSSNEIEPTDYDVFQNWINSKTIKSNVGIYSDLI